MKWISLGRVDEMGVSMKWTKPVHSYPSLLIIHMLKGSLLTQAINLFFRQLFAAQCTYTSTQWKEEDCQKANDGRLLACIQAVDLV